MLKYIHRENSHFNNSKMADLVDQYRPVGEKWTQVAHLTRNIPSNPTNTIEIEEILSEIAKEEEEILSSLKNLL